MKRKQAWAHRLARFVPTTHTSHHEIAHSKTRPRRSSPSQPAAKSAFYTASLGFSRMVTVRAAETRDADAAVDVVRRSITELCTADHRGDVDTLTKWLENKTPRHFLTWLANENNFCAIAVENDEVLGVGLINRSGEISLFYLAPLAQRRGIGRALHAALEEQARKWSLDKLQLNSTFAARHFYEAVGYVPGGAAKPHFGVLRCYPYEKMLKPNSRPEEVRQAVLKCSKRSAETRDV